MNRLVGSPSLKYAVIEALRTEDRSECVVLAYPDEGLLRDLIAANSIVALGFSSRDKAVANIQRRYSLSADSKNMVKAAVARGTEKCQRELNSARRRFSHWFCFAEFRRIAGRALQHTAIATILVFHSGNMLSAMIRTFFGG
jgi:hypothetical protein